MDSLLCTGEFHNVMQCCTKEQMQLAAAALLMQKATYGTTTREIADHLIGRCNHVICSADEMMR